MRSTKLQVNINLVVKLNDSITFLSAACAFNVKKSASSNITTLSGLNVAPDANNFTLSTHH